MLKYFDLLLALLEIEADVDIEKYKEIAIYIEQHKDAKYIFLHRHGFLFQAFLDLVLGKIDEEVFVSIGDVESKVGLSPSKIEDLALLQDMVVVIDQSVWSVLHNQKLEEQVAKNNLKILFS